MTLPPPPLTWGSECVRVYLCVRPFTAGNTGQDTMWSEARRQLLEWDASVADGYKVSFRKAIHNNPEDHRVSSRSDCALQRFICGSGWT